MPISPAQAERYAEFVRKVYEQAELTMLAKVAKITIDGIPIDGPVLRKLGEIRAIRKAIAAELRGTERYYPFVRDAIAESYRAGAVAAVEDIAPIRKLPPPVSIDALRTEPAVKALADTAVDGLKATHLRILRTSLDTYRRAVAAASAQVGAGVETRRQASQAVLNKLADSGITGFIDKAGRSWDLPSYAEMSVRSTTGQAAIQGHVETLTANGLDLVIVSDSPEECELCRPWEGKILSLSGNDSRYPSLADATADGLFHPSCTHTTGAWLPGLTRPQRNTAAPEKYEERQQQRYIERNIRKWKRREAVAQVDGDAAKAAGKVKEWQAQMKAFIDDTGRRRKRERESIKGSAR